MKVWDHVPAMQPDRDQIFRLGPGDYGTHPEYARASFLLAMREVAPEIFVAFREQVWNVVLSSHQALVQICPELDGKLELGVEYLLQALTGGEGYVTLLDPEAARVLSEGVRHVYTAATGWAREYFLWPGPVQWFTDQGPVTTPRLALPNPPIGAGSAPGLSPNVQAWPIVRPGEAEIKYAVGSTPWVLDAAVRTMRRWAASPDSVDHLDWAMEPHASTIWIPPKEKEFAAVDDGWDPQVESWLEFELRLMKILKSQLSEYRRRMEDLMTKKYHLRPVKRKRKLTESPDLHFRWLVLFQCKGMSFGDIADRYTIRRKGQHKGRDDSTVSKAVREAARLVGLKLRSERIVRK